MTLPPDQVGTGERAVPGQTEIAARVLERIAGRALTEVPQAQGPARRVRAQVDGQLAMLRMTVSVVYPHPVRQVTRQLRERVTSRVGELTGLEVRQVDISVAGLVPARRRAGRVR